MNPRVPVARLSLFQDRNSAALAIGGVAAALLLLLVLVLQGSFDGAMDRVTSHLRSSPAAVIVSEPDERRAVVCEQATPAEGVRLARVTDEHHHDPFVVSASEVGDASGCCSDDRARAVSDDRREARWVRSWRTRQERIIAGVGGCAADSTRLRRSRVAYW